MEPKPINNQIFRAVADKFKWDEEGVRFAIEEFQSSSSSLEKNNLISIYIDARDPDTRFKNAVVYFVKHIEMKGEAIAELISELLLKNDPCFQALAFFNYYDFYLSEREEDVYRIITSKRPSSNYNWNLQYSANNPSFIRWNSCPYSNESNDLSTEPNILNPLYNDLITPSNNLITLSNLLCYDVVERIDDITFDPDKLKYKFINIYLFYLREMGRLNSLFPEPQSTIDDLQPLFRRVLGKAGFLAFNIESFRNQVNYFSRLPNYKESKFNLEKIIETLVHPPKNKKDMTQRKYWLWYVFVEKLIENGLKPKPAFKRAGDILHENTTTIHRRYYVMKKKAKSGKMSRDEIIRDYDLNGELNEFLIKSGGIEGE